MTTTPPHVARAPLPRPTASLERLAADIESYMAPWRAMCEEAARLTAPFAAVVEAFTRPFSEEATR